MRIQFTITVEGVDINVEASSSYDYYAGLPHMECVGWFQFCEADSGVPRGSAARYYQDCDEITLLASSEDELGLAQAALDWLDKNNSRAWECMNWNTSSVGKPQDFERNEESEAEKEEEEGEEEEDSSMLDQSEESSAQRIESKKQFSANKYESRQSNSGSKNLTKSSSLQIRVILDYHLGISQRKQVPQTTLNEPNYII